MTHSPAIPVRLSTLHWGASDPGSPDAPLHVPPAVPPPAPPRALLLHGLPSAAGTWWRVASELAARGWAVTAPDLRGHGASPRAIRYRLADYAADVVELRPDRPVSQAAPSPDAATPRDDAWDLVIGHSLGGAVAVVAASTDPHWARALLLLDPVLTLPESDADATITDLLGDLDDLDANALLRAHPRWHTEDAVQKVNASRVVSPFVVERTVRDNPDWQLESLTAELRPRVHVLAADAALGASFSVDQGDRLAAAASTFSYVVVPEAGHSVHRDDPDRVVAEAVALVQPTAQPTAQPTPGEQRA